MQKKLTYDVYGVALLWFHPNTILTHNEGAIEVGSGIDWCSWCNWSCPHFSDSKLKWGVVSDHSTPTTRKKFASNVQWWNVPHMSNRLKFACECHTLPGAGSFHTGLQLSTWNWRWTTSLANKQTNEQHEYSCTWVKYLAHGKCTVPKICYHCMKGTCTSIWTFMQLWQKLQWPHAHITDTPSSQFLEDLLPIVRAPHPSHPSAADEAKYVLPVLSGWLCKTSRPDFVISSCKVSHMYAIYWLRCIRYNYKGILIGMWLYEFH